MWGGEAPRKGDHAPIIQRDTSSICLKGYEYTRPGAHFVTICTHERECLFGDVINGEMTFNAYGQIAHEEWVRSAAIRREIHLDAFIVMPNHLHGIVIITDDGGFIGAHGVGATGRSPLPAPHQPPTSRIKMGAGREPSEPSASFRPRPIVERLVML